MNIKERKCKGMRPLWMHLIECIVGKIHVSFLGRTYSFFISYGTSRNDIKNTLSICFDKAYFFSTLIQKHPNKRLSKGRADAWSTWVFPCSTPKADIIHCLCRPSHWAWKQTGILLHDWNLLWDENIFLQRSLCFIILFKYSRLLEIFLELSGTQGTEIFFNF